MNYVSNRVEEHGPPGRTGFLCSADGYTWGTASVAFPVMSLPEIDPPARYFGGRELPIVPDGSGLMSRCRIESAGSDPEPARRSGQRRGGAWDPRSAAARPLPPVPAEDAPAAHQEKSASPRTHQATPDRDRQRRRRPEAAAIPAPRERSSKPVSGSRHPIVWCAQVSGCGGAIVPSNELRHGRARECLCSTPSFSTARLPLPGSSARLSRSPAGVGSRRKDAPLMGPVRSAQLDRPGWSWATLKWAPGIRPASPLPTTSATTDPCRRRGWRRRRRSSRRPTKTD